LAAAVVENFVIISEPETLKRMPAGSRRSPDRAASFFWRLRSSSFPVGLRRRRGPPASSRHF